ncbi:S8 family serine peptidase [Promicromonospora sp. Marseille-Q5078]
MKPSYRRVPASGTVRARRAAVVLAAAALAVSGLTPSAATAAGDEDALVSPQEAAQSVLEDHAPDDPYATGDPDEGFVPVVEGDDAAALDAKLGDADQQLLSEAQASDDATVTVLLAVDPDRAPAVEDAVEGAGGVVGRSDRDLGYVRATVPTDDVPTLAGRGDVLAVDLDRELRVPDPTPLESGDDGATAASAATDADTPDAPSADTPADNPYLPVAETGAVRFTNAHRTWDGRGTVIGVLDTGVDLSHPALRTTTDGKPKILDWFTATDPIVDGDGTWKQLTTKVTGPSFRYGGIQYTAPEGAYTIAAINETASAASDARGDLNRDGDTSDRFALLYDPATHEIRVDSDADGDLVEETAMLPYGVDRQVGQLGTDDPSTDVVESMPFTVDYREDVDLTPLGGVNVGKVGDFVNLGVVAGEHGTHVAGIAAGNGLLGGDMRGAAPGAQIVSARACTWSGGCTSVALTEGMIDLVVEHDVDVVNVSIGGLVPLNDGSSAIARLYDELVDTYDVDIVAAAGNDGPGLNTVSPPSTGDGVISVAASVSDDTWFADYGSRVPTDLGLFPFSARGPSEDGSLKPTVSAPGAAVSTVPTWLAGESVPETGYDLPAGYGMLNGTSMASPQVAGDVALLRSAARATRLDVSSAGLRSAVVDSADLIDGVQVAAQGAGVVDVPGAWRRIVVDGVLKPQHADYEVAAPVCTALSGALATPGVGAGVHDRCLADDGGLAPGERTTYDVEVTRTSGASRARLHRLTLVGDDGTFDVPALVRLARGDATTLRVQAHPRTAGLHSALLRVDDPLTPGVDHVVPLTVVAADVAAAPARAVTAKGRVPRGGAESVFVAVPEGVQNLQVSLAGADGAPASGVRVRAFDPVGMPVDAPTACYTATDACDPANHSYERPRAGVWELVVEGSRVASSPQPGYRVRAVLEGVTFEPAEVTLDALDVQTPQQVDLTATNAWGTVEARPAAGALGRTVTLRGAVADGGTVQNRVDVPRDATLLDLTVTPLADGADVDVLLGHIATGRVVARAQEIGPGVERITVRDPEPGSYAVVVSGTSVPAAGVEFDYVEKLFSPSLGSLTVADGGTHELAPGDTLDLDVDVTAVAHPFGSRALVGSVPLVDAAGGFVGSAEVRVATVRTPQAEVLGTDRPFVGADMNSHGVVAGDAQISAVTTPVLWTADGGRTTLDVGPDGRMGSAYGINEAGDAAGQVLLRAGGVTAVLWRADGARVGLGVPEARDYGQTYAYDLNDATDAHGVQVVGTSLQDVVEDGATRRHSDPWVWTDGEGFRMLPHLGDDPSATKALAINDAGYVVGTSLGDDGIPHAVRWTPDGEVQDLGVLPRMWDAVAQGINAAGDVVGRSGHDAFVWTADGGMRRLPDLGFDGTAYKITDEGLVLGSAQPTPDDVTPVVWDADGKLFDVGRMVDQQVIYPTDPFAINGSTVLVYGYMGSGGGVALLDLPALP